MFDVDYWDSIGLGLRMVDLMNRVNLLMYELVVVYYGLFEFEEYVLCLWWLLGFESFVNICLYRWLFEFRSWIFWNYNLMLYEVKCLLNFVEELGFEYVMIMLENWMMVVIEIMWKSFNLMNFLSILVICVNLEVLFYMFVWWRFII